MANLDIEVSSALNGDRLRVINVSVYQSKNILNYWGAERGCGTGLAAQPYAATKEQWVGRVHAGTARIHASARARSPRMRRQRVRGERARGSTLQPAACRINRCRWKGGGEAPHREPRRDCIDNCCRHRCGRRAHRTTGPKMKDGGLEISASARGGIILPLGRRKTICHGKGETTQRGRTNKKPTPEAADRPQPRGLRHDQAKPSRRID